MKELAGLYLFGSAARGDADAASDIDVLAIYEHPATKQIRSRVEQLAVRATGSEVALAEYSTDRIMQMFDEGHLFAWHIYQEAEPLQICGLNFAKLGVPNPYRSSHDDARRFGALLDSVHVEIATYPGSVVYEAGLAYLSLRNIAMSLSSQHLPRIDFSRHSPFHLSDALGISQPCAKEDYEILVSARHCSQRGIPAPCIDAEWLRECVAQACKWKQTLFGQVEV